MNKKQRKIGVCYILSYYSPDYIRTHTLVEGLKNLDFVTLYQARNESSGILRYLETIYKLIVVRVLHSPDYYILGFRGHEIFWIVRLITLGKPLLFDQFMSPYDSIVNEHETVPKNGLLARFMYHYERLILQSSDLILTDTTIHKEYFAELFEIERNRIRAIHIGTDEDLFRTSSSTESQTEKDSFEVFFYGTFLPLHGVDIIIEAASMLQDLPIRFTLAGGHRRNLSNGHKIDQNELKNLKYIGWVDHERLPEFISQADLCLGGPFGNSGQACRVVTGKTFQFLAMGKPTVVGELAESYGFEDKKNCLLVPQGEPRALAEAIQWAFYHRSECNRIGQAGRELYETNFSIANIEKQFRRIFVHELLSTSVLVSSTRDTA